MQQLDRDVAGDHALVVDGNPTSRSVLVQALRDCGFGSVRMVGRVCDARELLEHRRVDLVICQDHFESSNESGQDLLDELRRERMLPYSTVFMMVTGDATYQKVAEAAEAALDSYLVKPFSGNALYERLKEARQRKRVLKDIFDSIDAGRYELAAQLCLDRFDQRGLYWLYAARIGTELLLDLKRHDHARRLLDAVIEAKSLPWARLGIARVQLAEGDVATARRTINLLLGEAPQFADSYDLLGKVQLEQGQIGAAMETYRAAATITPGCILRLQHCGTLAFYAGDTDTAAQMLERTWIMGRRSKLFDPGSLLLLACVHFDRQDAKGLQTARDALERHAQQQAPSPRLQRLVSTAQALSDLLGGRTASGVAVARALAGETGRADFDTEAATQLLMLWSRLDGEGLETAEYERTVRAAAMRFSVSRAATEVLAAASRRQEVAVGWVRQAHAEVMQRAESAMAQALRGEPRAAVEALLRHGGDTGNAKLIEMATLVAQRHRDRIDGVDALLEAAGELTRRYCTAAASPIAGVQRGNRSPGGMVLRR